MVALRFGKLVMLATLTAFLFWFFPAFEAPAGAQASAAQVATWDR
jgi:hypothetical protein